MSYPSQIKQSPIESQSGKGTTSTTPTTSTTTPITNPSTNPSAGCGCQSTGVCPCPPGKCTCPNCPRDQGEKGGAGEIGTETRKMPSLLSSPSQQEKDTSTTTTTPRDDTTIKQTTDKPGEYGRKMPYIESAGLDVGKPITLGGVLNLASLTQFPSESDRLSIDSSLKEPFNSLLEIRECLVNRLNQGNYNRENLKSCSDHVDHWEGQYRSKEGIFSQSGANFSSKTNQIPKGQEILQRLHEQIRDLHSVMQQRLEQGCTKEISSSPTTCPSTKISGEKSSLMQGGGEGGGGDYSKQQSGTGVGEIRATETGTGTKKAAQESGTERY